jgi:hypothetical protein
MPVARKKNNSNAPFLVHELLRILVELKIYHWSTLSFARHKASDQCFTTLQTLTDQFMEAVLGLSPQARKVFQADLAAQPVLTVAVKAASTDKVMEARLLRLEQMLRASRFTATDLANIRDEMLTAVHTCLYLFTLD